MDNSSDGTVGKALDVLDLVVSHGRPARFSDLLEASPFPRATLHRLLQTLTSQGLLTQDPTDQSYRPGLRLVRLAHAAWAQSSLAPVARAWIDRLADDLGKTIHLAELDQGQVLYIDKRDARSPVRMFSQAGKVGPAYCTAVGKAMLAHLDPAALEAALRQQSFHAFTARSHTSRTTLAEDLARIRARGHALDDEEHEAGIICAAVPILSTAGRVIGALSVTATTAQTTLATLEALVPQLRDAARDIAREAEVWRFPE